MSAELQFQTSPPLTTATLVAVVRNPAGKVWQVTTSTFVTWVDANIANYAIPLVEQGSTSGYYVGDFPAGITIAGQFPVIVYQVAASVYTVQGEGSVEWNGTAEVQPSGLEPVTLADMKLHLRYSATDQDSLISVLITAAREWAEAFCKRTFLTSINRIYTLDGFPQTGNSAYNRLGFPYDGKPIIHLPFPPIQSVTSITYLDVNGVRQTLDPTKYVVDLSKDTDCRIIPSVGNDWPTAQTETIATVTINHVTGYASGAPMRLVQAVKLLVGHWFWNRESVGAPQQFEVPMTVRSLLSTLRTF
jgi:uncharacterized phiE125 gp8 family phage protein